jgi:hypothetical protein
MFPHFVGVNDKFVNLDAIALIEDKTEDGNSAALITTADGAEIELTGTDADIVFERIEMFATVTDEMISRLMQGGNLPAG